ARSRGRRIQSDDVALDDVAIGARVDNVHAAKGVARDDITGPGGRSAQRVTIRAVAEDNPHIGIALGSAGGVQPNPVAENHIACRTGILNLDTVIQTAGDDVARAGHSAANGVVGGAIGQLDPVAVAGHHTVAYSGGAVDGQADVIADYLVVGCPRAGYVDAFGVVAGNDVARTGRQSTDGIAGAAVGDLDPAQYVAAVEHAGGVRADVIARDSIVSRGADRNPVSGVARDEVAFTGDGTADGVGVCTSGNVDPVAGVADDGRAVGGEPDNVALNSVVRGAGLGEADAEVVVARDDISGAGHGTADGIVVSGAEDRDALIGVSQIDRTRTVETDVVTRNGIVVSGCADDLDAIDRVGRDDVALGGITAADLVAGAVLNEDADLVPLRRITRCTDAQIIAGNDVVG
ncbi:MAG: hypothetical protein P8X85_21615, partial [Desulfobacterales bacterium]